MILTGYSLAPGPATGPTATEEISIQKQRTNTSATNSWTFTGITTTAGDKAIIVFFGDNAYNLGTRSVTLGGTSETSAYGAYNGNVTGASIHIFAGVGAVSSGNIVVNTTGSTGGTANVDVAVIVLDISGYNSVHASDTNTGSPTSSLSTSVNVDTSGLVIAACGTNVPASTSGMTWTGATERGEVQINPSANDGNCGWAWSSGLGTETGRTVSVSFTSSTNRAGLATVSLT